MRVTVKWSGFTGSPGFTNLYFGKDAEGFIIQDQVDRAVARTDTWLASWQARLPGAVKLDIDPVVPVIDAATGDMTTFFNVTAPAQRPGGGSGNYSAASGACVNWYTSGVRNSRRVRGRTFIVPFAGSALGADGTLDDTALNGLRTATGVLAGTDADADLGVWARPTTPNGTDGVWYPVQAYTIPDKVAVLTSRRD
jgi:hypothetical protein